jgi:hypothetical protein
MARHTRTAVPSEPVPSPIREESAFQRARAAETQRDAERVVTTAAQRVAETVHTLNRLLERYPALAPNHPAGQRDCLDCGQSQGMKLQNVLGTHPTNIPLLYVCSACGCLLTIPPPRSPVIPSSQNT